MHCWWYNLHSMHLCAHTPSWPFHQCNNVCYNRSCNRNFYSNRICYHSDKCSGCRFTTFINISDGAP